MFLNANSIVQHDIQMKNGIMINVQSKCKKYRTHKKDLSWNTSTCIYENRRYLKSIVDNSVIVCDEIINVTDSV